MSSSEPTAWSNVNAVVEPSPEKTDAFALGATNLLDGSFRCMPSYVISIMLNVPDILSATEQSICIASVVSI